MIAIKQKTETDDSDSDSDIDSYSDDTNYENWYCT